MIISQDKIIILYLLYRLPLFIDLLPLDVNIKSIGFPVLFLLLV